LGEPKSPRFDDAVPSTLPNGLPRTRGRGAISGPSATGESQGASCPRSRQRMQDEGTPAVLALEASAIAALSM